MNKLGSVTEKSVENQILTFLVNSGIFCWKNQSTGTFDPRKGIFRKSLNKHHINGVPDIIGIIKDGRPLFIEVKRPYISKKTFRAKHKTQEEIEKLASDDQVKFINKAKNLGAVAFYADTLEVLEEQLALNKVDYKRLT
jgi:hypothetical protein